MKFRSSFAAFLSGVALSAMPLSAQVSLLPPQDAVPVPAAVVSTADNYLNPLLQKEWVQLDAESSIRGSFARLTPEGAEQGIGQATVQLTRNGAPVQTATTDADGRFVFNSLQVGTYGLVSRSADSVAAFALHVLPSGASNRLESDVTVYGTSAPLHLVNEVVRAHAVPAGSGSSAVYPEIMTDPVGDARQFSPRPQVQLRNGGTLFGRVSRPSGFGADDLSGNIVHILRNGIVVGHQATNPRGEFQVGGLTNGNHDFVIVGKDGIAVGSFMAVESGLAKKSGAAVKLVSAQPGIPDTLNVELIPLNDFFVGAVPPPQFGDEFDPGLAPIPGGGFVGPGGFAGGGMGGGFGGGGSGGGGFGGIGALLGIGGLAAGIAALASEDDGFDTVTASLVTP